MKKLCLLSLMLLLSTVVSAQIYTPGGALQGSSGHPSYIGIGTSSPKAPLQVNNGVSKVTIGSAYGQSTGWGSGYIGFNLHRIQTGWRANSDGASNGASLIYGNVGGDLMFAHFANTYTSSSVDYTNSHMISKIRMKINRHGKVGIGTLNLPNNDLNAQGQEYRLYVRGGIRTEELKVNLCSADNWCDYVFEEDYKLLPLSEVASYIKAHKHLPNVPSADELAAEGLELKKLTIIQQEKIEELFLHIIALEKKITSMQQQINPTADHKTEE